MIVVAAAAAAGAGAKNVPGTTYVDNANGYSVTIPTAWKLVPRSKPALTALVAQLKKKKKKQTTLASTYSSILSSQGGLNGLKAYVFQAFAWPAELGTPLLTEVSVGIVKTSKAYTTKDLPAIGAEFANALSSTKGSKIIVPKQVKLPAGAAEFIEGTIPAGTGLSTGVELYLIPHGKRLYELSFQIDARGLSQATLFTSIAQHFKLL